MSATGRQRPLDRVSACVFNFGWISKQLADVEQREHAQHREDQRGDAVHQLNSKLATRLLARLHANPVRSMVLLRTLFQTLPALNYTLALSGIRFRQYMLATLLGLTTWYRARKFNYPRLVKATWAQRLSALRESIWGLFLIVVVIGGIYSGIFTPTEAAAMSAAYAFFVAVFVYKDLTLKQVPVGVVYALWSGLGVVGISLIGWLFLGQTLDRPALIGLGLIVSGVVVLQGFSSSVHP